MGKAARFACIFVPMALSIAALIALLLTFLAGQEQNNQTLSNLYYMRADTSTFKTNITSNPVANNLLGSILTGASTNKLYDFYQVYMWNYCAGNTVNGQDTITYCSPRQAEFVFDPIAQWGLNNTIVQKVLPKGVDDAVSAYTKAVKFMFIIYAVAFGATAVSIIVGLFAICSRIGSCITTIVVSIATVITFASALTSTILYSILVGALNADLKPYKINSKVGTGMFALNWIAVAFSIGATLFWTFSICCVSGKSNRKNNNKMGPMGYGPFNAQSRGYAPVENQNPLMNQHSAYKGTEMHNLGGAPGPYHGRDSAYEPFRHQNV